MKIMAALQTVSLCGGLAGEAHLMNGIPPLTVQVCHINAAGLTAEQTASQRKLR